MSANKVFLGVPCYRGELHMETATAILRCSIDPSLVKVQMRPSSLLARSCNEIYVNALNERANGVTHFALLHADIGTDLPYWMDVLLEIMSRENADMVGVVSPMKDQRGLTSTCIFQPPMSARRLTMKEIFKRPETFSEDGLLLNTGMCLVRIDNERAEKYKFEMHDEILKLDGKFKARGFSEDWLFSRSVVQQGGKLVATREIPIKHYGAQIWGNQTPWGELETDNPGVY